MSQFPTPENEESMRIAKIIGSVTLNQSIRAAGGAR